MTRVMSNNAPASHSQSAANAPRALAARRCDLLIVPVAMCEAGRVRKMLDNLGPDNATTRIVRGAAHWIGWRAEAGADASQASDNNKVAASSDLSSGPVALTEGRWPEPLGLKLTASQDLWRIDGDTLAARPLYYAPTPDGGAIVSTRIELVAGLIDAPISDRGLAELLVLGFHLKEHTLFTDVHRTQAGQSLACRLTPAGPSFDSGRVPAVSEVSHEPPRAGWLDAMAQRTAEAFKRGFALEITGGVDSRFALALGLKAGVAPAVGFTIGDLEMPDVQIAQNLSVKCHFRHIRVPLVVDEGRIEVDGRAFASRANFAVNSGAFAWLPRAFDELAKIRPGQVAGVGGECVGGAYYTPLDWLCGLSEACGVRGVGRLMIKKRLTAPHAGMDELMGGERAGRLEAEVVEETVGLIREAGGGWRRGMDELFIRQIQRHFGVVLAASAWWYEPFAPQLCGDYVQWGRSMATGRKLNRRAQMRMIYEMDPQLGLEAYTDGRRFYPGAPGAARQRVERVVQMGRKAVKRFMKRGHAPSLGVGRVMPALLESDDVRQALHDLCGAPELSLDVSALDRLCGAPGAYGTTLGTLVSAAWARQAVRGVHRTMAS